MVADVLLGFGDGVLQGGVGFYEAKPDDFGGGGVELPEADDAAAVEDGVTRELREAAQGAFALLNGHDAFEVFGRKKSSEVAAQKADRVEAADESVARLFRNVEHVQFIEVRGVHKPGAVGFEGDELKRREGGFAGLLTQAGDGLELGERGRADPREVAAGKFTEAFFSRKGEFLERIGGPQDLVVALLVEASVDGDPANLAFSLKQTEGEGQGGCHPFLLAIFAEIAGGGADGVADFGGIEGAVLEGGEDGHGELFDFGVSDAELAGRVPFGFAEGLAEFEADGVVGGREDVGAAASGGKFVDFGGGDGVVNGFAREAGAGEEGQIRTDTGDGTGPSGGGENGRGRMPERRSIKTLAMGPPRAQERVVHFSSLWFDPTNLMLEA